MFVSPLNNNQINHGSIEDVNDSQITEHVEEDIGNQESTNTTKDLSNIFTLQAKAKTNTQELIEVYEKYGQHSQWMLNAAMIAGDYEAVKVLVEHGLNVNMRYGGSPQEQGQTILEIAIERNEKELIKYLLENGADPYSFRKVEVTREIFTFPTSKRTLREDGYLTAVYEVIYSGNLDILKIFSDSGVDFNQICIKNKDAIKKNLHPLNLALELGRKNAAEFLIEHGATLLFE